MTGKKQTEIIHFVVEFEQKSRFEPETMKPIIVCYVPDPLTHFRNVLRIQLLINVTRLNNPLYLSLSGNCH